ncbi:uncharacterized protein [Watersipora subatra]|uniref:uncharacterized protein n=1 Tax=Watersipora subatra TaxID=2589382 RepID=UPI00355BB8B5
MLSDGSFLPLIPSYHYLPHEDKLEYYCPWSNSLRKEITFPIITNYEHLQRVSKKRMRSRPVNRQDNLPSLRANSRPASRVNALTVPDNSQISTPCPPDDYSLQPPIIDNWREWNLHHIHV